MENMEEHVWLSDKIGTSYKDWEDGDVIFISAPTGAGKTSFIFEKLIPLAKEKKRRILYLVNRKILKQQLESRLNEMRRENICEWSIKDDDLIEIKTYQELEKTMQDYGAIQFYHKYNYIVMDEAHYFMSDALFNTSTELLFHELLTEKNRWARVFAKKYTGHIRIFMSATIENIYKYYQKIEDSLYVYNDVPFRNIIQIKIPLEDQYKKLNVHLFKGYEDIADVIEKAGNEKWLVFVDHREKGEKLNNDLKEKGINSVFIDAYYEKEPEALDEVSSIVEKKQSSVQVCIMTYVLDCGVSIEENRNHIVIFADNEIEFIQCLGRKRTINYGDIHLYIPVRTRRVFSERLTKMNNVVDFIQKDIKKTFKISEDDEKVKNRKVKLVEKATEDGKEWKGCNPWKLKLDEMELLKLVFANKKAYDAARKTCYVGMESVEIQRDVVKVPYACMSQLSMEQLGYLCQIYKNLYQEMENDEWAFVKMQLSWLRREDDFEEIKAKFCNDRSELLRQEIESKLSEFPENGMDFVDRIEWYNDIRKPLRELLQIKLQSKEKEKSLMTRLGKTASDRFPQIISEQEFNRLMEILQLPYKMEKEKGKNMFIRSV